MAQRLQCSFVFLVTIETCFCSKTWRSCPDLKLTSTSIFDMLLWHTVLGSRWSTCRPSHTQQQVVVMHTGCPVICPSSYTAFSWADSANLAQLGPGVSGKRDKGGDAPTDGKCRHKLNSQWEHVLGREPPPHSCSPDSESDNGLRRWRSCAESTEQSLHKCTDGKTGASEE